MVIWCRFHDEVRWFVLHMLSTGFKRVQFTTFIRFCCFVRIKQAASWLHSNDQPYRGLRHGGFKTSYCHCNFYLHKWIKFNPHVKRSLRSFIYLFTYFGSGNLRSLLLMIWHQTIPSCNGYMHIWWPRVIFYVQKGIVICHMHKISHTILLVEWH